MIRRVPRAVLAASLLAAFATSSACSREKNIVPTGILEGDKYLMDRATELVGKKKWFQAREYYRQLVDNYPQSNYRPDAKLGLGDTYLGEKSAEALVLAENEFREFLTFYPTNARADYAQYKLGMCHFQQMLAPDRDQTATKEAIAELALFVQRYPQSALLEEGRQKLRAAQNRLTESEYKVGYFYWRNKWYPGAIDRFKAVLKNDPEYPMRDAVYYYLGDSLVKMGRRAEAVPYFDRLTKEFEKSEFLDKAQLALKEQPAEPPPPVKK
ncbi:MAG: outer membrane protein assembly factor BamD [Vicinamibacterales bacterium]|jgi:outer membrane protein assembly factor BamD|nr:outer membrane protein assembly factor BamD [Vicinamibacterales bacterium]